MSTFTARIDESAFSLIEAAIVLGVVGLIIGGIWIAAAAVSESRAIQQDVSGILTVVEKMRQTSSIKNIPPPIAINALIDSMKIVPDGFTLIDDTQGYSTASGIRVSFSRLGSSPGVQVIALSRSRIINQGYCIRLAVGISSAYKAQQQTGGLISITTVSTTPSVIVGVANPALGTSWPISPDTTVICGGTNHTMTFAFAE